MGSFRQKHLRGMAGKLKACASSPKVLWALLKKLPAGIRARSFASKFSEKGPPATVLESSSGNPLQEYFESHTEGHGIWKWQHYFDIYHRHLCKFVGRELNVLEIGIYSGGSLDMWRSYFGTRCHIYGVDIEEACKGYENEYTSVFIGDQSDRGFWSKFRRDTPPMDILIDDGGHEPEQQRTTLEEMLPHLRCGGVYFCEDIHGIGNDFSAFAAGLVDELNHCGDLNGMQKSVHSVHFYPYCVVIEKHVSDPGSFVAPKRGTKWQPFFDK